MTAPLGRLVRWVEQERSHENSGRQTEGIGIPGVNRPTGQSPLVNRAGTAPWIHKHPEVPDLKLQGMPSRDANLLQVKTAVPPGLLLTRG